MIQRLTQRLTSVRLTFYALVVLVCLMGIGSYLSLTNKPIFLAMNESGIMDWFPATWQGAPWVMAWFLALCLAAAVLFINGIACCLLRQLPQAKRSRRKRFWVFFILHCLFLLVLGCHGLALVSGTKLSHIHLFPGETQKFGPYEILVSQVIYQDDMAILSADKKKQRAMMTQKNIRLSNNWADLTLSKNNVPLVSGRIKMLSPLRSGFLQITLTQFLVDPTGTGPGVNLVVTHNILNALFFTAYAVMIFFLAGYTILTWKKPT